MERLCAQQVAMHSKLFVAEWTKILKRTFPLFPIRNWHGQLLQPFVSIIRCFCCELGKWKKTSSGGNKCITLHCQDIVKYRDVLVRANKCDIFVIKLEAWRCPQNIHLWNAFLLSKRLWTCKAKIFQVVLHTDTECILKWISRFSRLDLCGVQQVTNAWSINIVIVWARGHW